MKEFSSCIVHNIIMTKFPLNSFEENLLPEFPNYHISKNGRLFTNKFKNATFEAWFELKPHITPLKRVRFSLSNLFHKRERKYSIELIFIAYVSKNSNDFILFHKDGNFQNCSLENIGFLPVGQKIVPIDKLNDNISGHNGYHATKCGKIFSRISHRRGSPPQWIELFQRPIKNGYLTVKLQNPKRSNYLVHRLVALAYIGEIPPDMHVCHNDGDKLNNDLSNLRIDTPKNNASDRHLHGTAVLGEDMSCAKLTEKDIPKIFEIAKNEGLTKGKIAKIFNVSAPLISRILERSLWKHVEIPQETVCKVNSLYKKTQRKFTKEKIIDIHSMALAGFSKEKIAQNFNSSVEYIKRILCGEKWPKVKEYFELEILSQLNHFPKQKDFETTRDQL